MENLVWDIEKGMPISFEWKIKVVFEGKVAVTLVEVPKHRPNETSFSIQTKM